MDMEANNGTDKEIQESINMKLKTEAIFDAAHHLEGYSGVCSRIHGHQWRVVVWVKGDRTQLDKVGILWDFTKLKKIISKLDHQDLNEVFKKGNFWWNKDNKCKYNNPTAENIAMYILAELIWDKHLEFRVRVYESPTSWAEVEG